MKKYLGAYPMLFTVIFTSIFCVGCVGLAVYCLLMMETFDASGIFALFLIVFTVYVATLFAHFSNIFLSWGTFTEEGVSVKSWFRPVFTMEYAKCRDVGIAVYVPPYNAGVPYIFIYLSYDPIAKRYLHQINELRPTERFIRVGYSKKMYNYLMGVLPKQQACLLKESKVESGLAKKEADRAARKAARKKQ